LGETDDEDAYVKNNKQTKHTRARALLPSVKDTTSSNKMMTMLVCGFATFGNN